MIEAVPPAFIFILGAFLIPLLKGKLKQVYLLVVPTVAFLDILYLNPDMSWIYHFLGYELVFCRVDRLSLVIGYIFTIIGFLAILYSLHTKEDGQHIAAFLYVGSSLGVVFAGDYFSLFAFWEIMAVASVFLIWYQKDKESLNAGFRYILMHIFGGCCLLVGIIIYIGSSGSIGVDRLEPGIAYWLILAGFGLNTAFIPIHTWLPDGYPESTITGGVFLSVFTTKTGVYVLARCFAGADFVAYMGGIMAVYGVIFALLQNDARKLLSYHIVSQVGYMVAGVGVGTALGVNGGIAHVFNHILYKALLFMCMGSVIYMTGRRKLTELGGLARYMPVTCIACVIAALSISGAPGFNGFVSKGMVISSAVEVHKPILELMLILASVGTFLSFVKLCYFTFFAENPEIKSKEPPRNMQLAMGLTAFLCVFIGVYPQALFDVLPFYPVHYHPFTLSHVIGVIQLFMLAGVVFMLAKDMFAPHRATILDFDYFYRMGGRGLIWVCVAPLSRFRFRLQLSSSRAVDIIVHLAKNPMMIFEIPAAYIYLRITRGLRYVSGYSSAEMYNENLYRRPIGVGVLVAIILLFAFALIHFIF
ncbi:MAG: Na(+)/H(+) antiporter subunit D [Deltaproteobacteria bacterium]|nr:Na(+)/H(+) antiporter subunit D [Deltaproteobacteria bacterium]MBW2340835.1 Na(+)/H(+) antiporter subunit D [Deltaproteobacteria bacterium]